MKENVEGTLLTTAFSVASLKETKLEEYFQLGPGSSENYDPSRI